MNLSLEEIVSRADALYDMREQVKSVRASVALLDRSECANDFEATWRLGRAHFFLGQEAGNDDEAHSHHLLGVTVCRRAVSLNPSRVEGNFWLGVNLALLARLENSFRALICALRARRSLQRAVRLGPGYHGAGPLRVLARLQHKLPRSLAGGRKRARINFERAVEIAPANSVTRVYYAELLLEMGETAHAREHLESLLNSVPEPGWTFESERDRQTAREMLKNAEGKPTKRK